MIKTELSHSLGLPLYLNKEAIMTEIWNIAIEAYSKINITVSTKRFGLKFLMRFSFGKKQHKTKPIKEAPKTTPTIAL